MMIADNKPFPVAFDRGLNMPTGWVLGGLPPLCRLSVQTGVQGERDEKAARLDEEDADKGEGGAVPELPEVLWDMIKSSYLEDTPYSLDQLDFFIKWCDVHEIRPRGRCSESIYYDVVTKYIGPKPNVMPPKFPEPFTGVYGTTSFYDMFTFNVLKTLTANDRSTMNEMNDAAKSVTFWRTMMVKCVEELSRLPPSMVAPFLNSNEAQRARWKDVFVRRELVWLQARVDLGGKMASSRNLGYFSYGQEEDVLQWEKYESGECVDDDFEQKVNGWIKQGWEFDWVLGNVFHLGFKREDYTHRYADYTEEELIGAMKCFEYRVEELISAGAEPMIEVTDLAGLLPSVGRKIEFDNHYEFRFLKLKLDLLLKHKIFVNFNKHDDKEYRWRFVFTTLAHCSFGVSPQVKSWELHAQRHHDNNSEARAVLFKSYYELTKKLCELIIHLASPEGSNVHKEASDNMRHIIVTGLFDYFCSPSRSKEAIELYELLRTIQEDGPFKNWPEIKEWPEYLYFEVDPN